MFRSGNKMKLEIGQQYRFYIDGYSFLGIIIHNELNEEYPYEIVDTTTYSVVDAMSTLEEVFKCIENVCMKVAEMLLMYKDNFNLEVETKTSEIDVLKIIVKDKNNIIDIYRVYNPTKDEINNIKNIISLPLTYKA